MHSSSLTATSVTGCDMACEAQSRVDKNAVCATMSDPIEQLPTLHLQAWQAVAQKDAEGLLLLTSSVDEDKLTEMVDDFDVSSAQATQPADRTRILSEISSTIGIPQFNASLKQALLASILHQAKHSFREDDAIKRRAAARFAQFGK